MKDLTVSVATENTDNLGLGGIGVGTNVRFNVLQSAMIESGAALVKMTNSELADRQAKRHYSDSKAASVADYMGKYGI
jgi:hypothetical protein